MFSGFNLLLELYRTVAKPFLRFPLVLSEERAEEVDRSGMKLQTKCFQHHGNRKVVVAVGDSARNGMGIYFPVIGALDIAPRAVIDLSPGRSLSGDLVVGSDVFHVCHPFDN